MLKSLIRLGPGLAVAVGVTVATWPWLAGPAAVGVAAFAGTVVSNMIDARLSQQPPAWLMELGQGAVAGIAAWLMLRWLTG